MLKNNNFGLEIYLFSNAVLSTRSTWHCPSHLVALAWTLSRFILSSQGVKCMADKQLLYLLRWALRTSWWNRCCARTSPRGTLGSVYFTNRHILETVGKLKIKGIYWKSVFFFYSDTCWSCSHHCSSRGGRRPSASAIVTSYPVQIIFFCLP